MRRTRKGRVIAGLGLMFAIAITGQEAAAQYTCRFTNGALYNSSSPCVSTQSPTRSTPGEGRPPMVYYGPLDSGNRGPVVPPSSGEAPRHIRYMGPRCASLHDAQRTAAVRGLRPETVREMRREYSELCADDERQAMKQLGREEGDAAREREGAQATAQRQRERSALEIQQCGESKRILYSKRARTDLTDGEKADLQRFEDNYKSRCG